MSNKKITSASVASLAAKVLHSKQTSTAARMLAGSALSQVNKGNTTGKSMETFASSVLSNQKYSSTSKKLAASILSQSNKKR